MALFRIANDKVEEVSETSFQVESLLERRDLQRLFRDRIDILVPDAMVLCEEFGRWEDSRRRIDLLCLDRSGQLVVVELKRTEDGGHMDLQAIRYAAMISKMTFSTAVEAHQTYLDARGLEGDAEESILKFLGWDEPQEDEFASETLIVLASREFSKELTTAVIWLSEHDIDIRCIKLKPYRLGAELLLDVEQIFPLPEAADYQVRLREKEREERRIRHQNRDLTRFELTIGDRRYSNLPKRRLAFLMVREAVRRGAKPLDVLAQGRYWLIVPSYHDQDSLRLAAENDRDPASSSAAFRRFFT